MNITHTEAGPFPTSLEGQTAWRDGHKIVGYRCDDPGDATPTTGALLDNTITSGTGVTTSADDDSGAAADEPMIAVATILSGTGTSPKIDINGDGSFSRTRLFLPGDTIRPQCHTPNTNSAETVVRVKLTGGRKIDWSVTTSASSYDPDADAYFTAAGITDPTFKTAYNNYVIALKASSVYSKQAACYPFFGTTATEQKWNAVDPRDLDAAYRITWHGSGTHDANGFTGDGSSAYAETHFEYSNFTSTSSGALALHNRTDTAPAMAYDSGMSTGADGNWTGLISEYGSGASYGGFGTNTYNCNVSAGNSIGRHMMNRHGASNTELWKDGVKVKDIADTVTLTLSAGVSLFIGCSNKNGTPSYFCNKNWGMYTIFHTGLDATEQAAWDAATATYLAAIGR